MYKQPHYIVTMVKNAHPRSKFFEYLKVKFEVSSNINEVIKGISFGEIS